MKVERRFKMRRLSAMVLVLGMVVALAGLALAAEKEKTPDATLKLSEGQVAVGIGWSWGKCVLTLKGKDYPFKVGGLSVGDVGITKAEAEGKVYNLKKLEDFNGTYVSAAAAATGGVGGGAGHPAPPPAEGDENNRWAAPGTIPRGPSFVRQAWRAARDWRYPGAVVAPRRLGGESPLRRRVAGPASGT